MAIGGQVLQQLGLPTAKSAIIGGDVAKSPRYSDHLDTLIALVTHLAMTDWSMRTASNLAKALSIDEAEIQYALDNFKGLFRRSPSKSKKTGGHFYTLQIRHVRQWLEDATVGDEEGPSKPPLEAEYLTTLLNFVTHKATERQYGLGLLTAWIAAAASLIVAGARNHLRQQMTACPLMQPT